MIHRKLLIATAIIASVVITACSEMTGPKNDPGILPAAAMRAPHRGPATVVATIDGRGTAEMDAPGRSGALHVTKECSQYTRLAGGFCTITSSNLKAIEVGTRVVYAVASGPTVLNSDVVLDPPGPGHSVAFGHVVLDLATGQGMVTIWGGTGKFARLHARAVVSRLIRPNWAWDGTYSFSNKGDADDRD
jgi:hypothetical protein